MEIKFSVKEYFDELKLMQEQYGREEDVYPWVYMLLQMAEAWKETNKENEEYEKYKDYKKLSIRDVHNLKKPRSKEHDIEMTLRKGVGAPDFAIIDKGEIIGCVEIKVGSFSQELKQDGTIEFKKRYKKQHMVGRKEKINVEEWTYTIVSELKIEKPNQLLGHLEKYGKVIYTNGKEFYFFIIEKRNGKSWSVVIIELANLQPYYHEYVENKVITNGAEEEWKKLIAYLKEIDWRCDNTQLIEDLKKLPTKKKFF